MNIYKTNEREYARLSEAKAAARQGLIGFPSGSYLLVYRRQGQVLDGGFIFWEPIARAEVRGAKIVCS